MNVTPKLKRYLSERHGMPATLTDNSLYAKRVASLIKSGQMTPDELETLLSEADTMADPSDILAGKTHRDVRVKNASERYSNKRYEGRHTKTGDVILDTRGEPVTRPSELTNAKTGVLIKHLAAKAGVGCQLNSGEHELLQEMADTDQWAGEIGGEYTSGTKGSTLGVKALLDSSTSGGIEVAPIFFDADVISTPQLSGELFPFVDRRELSRGRRIEGASIGQVTVTSSEGVDGSEMSLFNTDDLFAELNTTIFSVGCAIEVGRDFLSDAAVDVGQLVSAEIGASMMAWLDEQIALGDGTTEPEGIMVASGTTAVSFGGSMSVGGVESLLFAVPKAQRSPSTVFCSNETTYSRVRAIPVGAADARRIFGMTHEDYKIFDRSWKIQTDLANTKGFFGDLKKYRMYVRKGMSIEVNTQGNYLQRRNLALITARMRVGGRVMLPSSFATVTTFPS